MTTTLREPAAALPELIICSRLNASRRLCADIGPAGIRSLVSIGDPGMPLPQGFERAQSALRLEFYDIGWSGDPCAPTEQHLRQVVAFAPRAAELGGTCLVHCEAGISRSPATAIVLLAALLGPGEEARAVEEVLQRAPTAMPNSLVVRRGDDVLGRRGALCSAVAARFDRLPFL